MSAGLIWNLSATGILLSDARLKTISHGAIRMLILGLAISLPTGFTLFAPRASYTAPSGVFQLKMALLVAGAVFQFGICFFVLRRRSLRTVCLRVSGVLGMTLWVSLAVTACWFILFE